MGSDVGEELVVAKVLDVDISQLVAIAIDGMNAHVLEVVGQVKEVTDTIAAIAHINGVPHGRVFAEIVPRHAHL